MVRNDFVSMFLILTAIFKGITRASLSKIFQHAQVPKEDQTALENFFKLDSKENFDVRKNDDLATNLTFCNFFIFLAFREKGKPGYSKERSFRNSIF